MKKLLSALLVAVLLPLTACAAEYEKDTHYEEIASKATSKPQLEELFSFWCPHCYNFEPIVASIKKGLDDGVEFKKVHVDFLGFASRELQRDMTKAMLVGQTLKVEDKVNAAIFAYLHKQRARITSIKDIRNIFMVQGIEGEQFDKAMKSFTLNGMFKQNQKILESYKGKVTGVPAFIVNGKYKVNTASVKSIDEMLDLINHLLKKTD